jgi:hypothetical protein
MRSHDYKASGLSNYTYPVVVIPGLNHASFLSGVPPSKVKETDIRAEIPIGEAIDSISDAASAFLTIHGNTVDKKVTNKSMKTLDYLINDVTASQLDHIVEVFAKEGHPDFHSFRNSTPIVEESMRIVAGDLAKEHKIEVADEYIANMISGFTFLHAKPSISQDPKDSSKTLIKTFTHTNYNIQT